MASQKLSRELNLIKIRKIYILLKRIEYICNIVCNIVSDETVT